MNQPITVPELDQTTLQWIEQEARRSGVSIETVVRRLIYRGVELERKAIQQQTHHDLDALAGTWTEEDLREFEQATEIFEQIDPALWK